MLDKIDVLVSLKIKIICLKKAVLIRLKIEILCLKKIINSNIQELIHHIHFFEKIFYHRNKIMEFCWFHKFLFYDLQFKSYKSNVSKKIYSTKHLYSGKVKQELRVTNYEAQIHELRVKIYELRIQIHELEQ